MSFLRASAAALLAIVGFFDAALAQSYPSQPLKLIVPFGAGGITDLLARLSGEHIKAVTGQPVIIENRPGAGGNTGLDAVAKASPDGYTIGLFGIANFAVNPHLYRSMPFEPLRDLVAVAPIAEAPQILIINAKVPASDLAAFSTYAKANPGKLNYSSAGIGTPLHLVADQIIRRAGIAVAHVPYRSGGLAVGDVVAGNTQMIVVATGLVIEHVRAGTLRVLATATSRRLPFLPDVPTLAEAGLAIDLTSNWFGIAAPARTPGEIVAALNAAIGSMAEDKGVLEKLERAYMLPMRMKPQEVAGLIASDGVKWQKIIKDAGVTAQ